MSRFASEITAGVWRISLPHPALFATNAYLLRGDPPMLIDAGHGAPVAAERLGAALAEAGLRAADIGRIVLTDAWADRVGGLLQPGRPWPSAVVGGEAGVRHAGADYGTFSTRTARMLLRPVEDDPLLARVCDDSGLRELVQQCWSREGRFAVDEVYGGAAAIELGGGRRLHPVHLPGPTAFHMGYFLEPDGLLFSGDLVHAAGYELPLLCSGHGGALRSYLRSVAWAAGLSPKLLLPAAGLPVAAPELALARARRAAGQFRDNLLGIVVAGPRTLATVLSFMTLGEGLTPLRRLLRLHALITLVDDLVGAREMESLYEGGSWNLRLAPAFISGGRAG